MAYQPKSYKKFVATAATATLVASAIAPVASAASFSDVADRYKEAVDYLTTEGYAQGYPGGKFGTDDNIKRQDAAVMIARALGATEDGDYANAGFTDVPADRQWAVNFLVEKKIVSGKAAGRFGANDFTTREEMSKILAGAYNLVGNPDNEFPFTDVSNTFKQYVDALYEAGITQGKSATQFGTGLVTRGEFALFVFRAENPSKPAAAEVEAVVGLNAKQVQVKFKTAMDESTLVGSTGDLLNVVFDETTNASAAVNSANATGELSADGKTLTITLGANEVFSGTYAITLSKNVKTEDGRSLVDYSGTFSIKDEVAPQIVSVSAKTNSNVATSAKIAFSEPVSTAVVKINGTYYSATGLETDVLTVNGLALDVTKTHTVEVINATDAVGNTTQQQSVSFVVNQDTVAPTVTTQPSGDHRILLTFDKAMNPNTVNTSSVKVVEEDFTSLAAGSQYTVSPVAGSGNKQFVVDVSKPLYASKTTRTLTVQVNDIARDSLGNKAVTTTQNVVLTKDTVSPVNTAVNVVNDANGNASKLRVTFSEKIGSTVDTSKVSAKNANTGVDLVASNLITNPVVLSDGQTVEFTVQQAARGTKVNFVFAAGFVKDTAQTPNNSAGFASTVDFNVAASAFALTQGQVTSTTQNVITINYATPVVGDFGPNAANNPANYTVAGQTLPAGTEITVSSDRTTVTIELPDEFITATDSQAVLTVNNVKSVAGSTIKPFVGTVPVKDNVTPKLNNVVWNANGSFSLDFSEGITTAASSGTEAGVQITVNNGQYVLGTEDYRFTAGTGADAGNIVATLVSATDSTYGAYIELGSNSSYDAGTDVLVADIVNVTVKTLSPNNIVDAAGNSAKANITVTGNKY